MSELFEFIFELIVEVFFEAYIKLMQLIVPQKNITEKTRKILKFFVCSFACVLLLSMFCGLLLLLSESASLNRLGKYLMIIPLIISIAQIILGIFVKLTVKK